MPHRGWTPEQMARRVAQDFWDGAYVNLGIGLPTLVSDFLPADREVVLHSENGILGMGGLAPPEQADPDLVNAGKQSVLVLPGACFFNSSDSFAMLRGGHVDVGVLGAYQVSARGDLANWSLPGQTLSGIGGAADIAVGVRQLWVLMKHSTPGGQPRILRECTYPLTSRGTVKRIYTDMAVVDVTPGGLKLVEIAPGYAPEEVVVATQAQLLVTAGSSA
jgi:3-oxoacid CoA-transferase B subunit